VIPLPTWLTAAAAKVLGVLVMLGLALLTLFSFGRQQRAVSRADAAADIVTKTLEIKNAQQQAAAAAPVDRNGVVGRLRDGSF
jgi:hypothetical protein